MATNVNISELFINWYIDNIYLNWDFPIYSTMNQPMTKINVVVEQSDYWRGGPQKSEKVISELLLPYRYVGVLFLNQV